MCHWVALGDIDPSTTYSQMERSSDSVKPSKTAEMRWPRISVMGQLIRMNLALGWLGLICLHLVQGAEGSVGQNIQYPQVCAPNMQVTLSFPEYLVSEHLLAFTSTKAYFCALPPLWALFALFRPKLRANNFTFST